VLRLYDRHGHDAVGGQDGAERLAEGHGVDAAASQGSRGGEAQVPDRPKPEELLVRGEPAPGRRCRRRRLDPGGQIAAVALSPDTAVTGRRLLRPVSAWRHAAIAAGARVGEVAALGKTANGSLGLAAAGFSGVQTVHPTVFGTPRKARSGPTTRR
jgi:hypothetical protein